MLPTHDVPCPRCGGTLYSATSLEDGVNAGAAEAPKLEHDAAGEFMTCPSCRARIAMRRVPGSRGEEVLPVP